MNPLPPSADNPGQGWLGFIDDRDRTEIFTETATAATAADVPYWLVLSLAGAIAALGLALNSSAVIIGAMLIAPLLAPVVGLGLSLAIGDGRLAVQTALIVLASTIAVVLVGALLALALPVPFQTTTTEIAARTRPTTLDLVIAVFSGLAGATVSVARRSRLSGAVPGVAVAVALVPPLAVTGYGIGTGWNWPIIRGSLLLYGANLAGIVMSGMAVFLIAGMHRPQVLQTDALWHERASRSPFSAWVERIPGLRSLGLMQSVWARLALVVGFAAVVAIPLRASLQQIARETRVQRAVEASMRMFNNPGHSFIISRDVELGQKATHVVLNVATTEWFADSTRREFERHASANAGEPVSLELDQLPASGGDLSNFATLLSVAKPSVPNVAAAAPPPTVGARASLLRGQVADAIRALTFPDSVLLLDFELGIRDSIIGDVVRLSYLAPEALSAQAVQILHKQLAGALSLPRLTIDPTMISPAPRIVHVADTAALDYIATVLSRHPQVGVEVIAGRGARQADVDSITSRLRRASGGMDSSRLSVGRSTSARGVAVRLRFR
jgi:uncharacterized hydrophobic protein (TIGR00271 family)